jgi:hypothetical protein
VYGLLPRLLTLLLAHWQVRRSLRRTGLDHHDFLKLAERVRRPLVETRATTAEADDEITVASGEPIVQLTDIDLGSRPLPVLQWAGVDMNRQQIAQLVEARLGVAVGPVHTVGGLDHGQDEQSLRTLQNGISAHHIVLLVEAWEPPVAEYVDLLTRLREILGSGSMIVVLLYHRDQGGSPVPPSAVDLEIWRRQLSTVGDPWLAVEPLVASAASTVDQSASGEGDG